ncbi:MAG: MYXO-CTERM sorting domain-containing protein [Kofleriaceae bacterium]
MQRWLLPLTLAATIGLAPRPADACDLVSNRPHERDPAHAADTVAPSAPRIVDTTVGRSEDDAGCGAYGSCGSYGWFQIEMQAFDDATPADRIGYQVRLIGGVLPAGLTLPTTPLFGEYGLTFYFDIDAPSFVADLEVRAIDLNGNLGPPTVVTIADHVDDGGCAAGGRTRPIAGAGVALLVLGMLVRRRRR